MSTNINGQLLTAGLDCWKLLEHLGAHDVSSREGFLRASCMFHEEKTPSFDLNLSNGTFICFGCNVSGDLIDLVKMKQQITFLEACEWLMKFCGLVGHPEEFLLKMALVSDSNQFIIKMQKFSFSPKPINESVARQLSQDNLEFYFQKGFSREILEEFEVGYFSGRLWFPIRNETGILMGMSGRSLDPEEKSRKWIHSVDLSKNELLYNLHHATKYGRINHTKELIIVEGPVDCMKASMFGKKNAVALLGHRISDSQKRLLLKHAFRVVLALDADEAGEMGTEEAKELLKGDFEVFTMPLPAGKDVGDLTGEEFTLAYSQKARALS